MRLILFLMDLIFIICMMVVIKVAYIQGKEDAKKRGDKKK